MIEQGAHFRRNLLLVCVLLFIPILLVPYLPFLDYPNHLVRYSWLAKFSDTPEFKEFFETNWRLMPNVGFDILGVLACKVMPPLLAGRVLLFLTLVGGGYGFGLLTSKLGSHPAVSLLSPAFLISTPLFLGFNNYMLGIAIVPYMLLSKMRSGPGNFALYVVLSLLSFVCHGEAAFLGLIVSVLWQARQSGGFSRATILALLVPLICMVILVKLGPSSSELSTIKWGDLKSKGLVLNNGLKTNWRLVDILWAVSLIAFGCWMLRSKIAKFNSSQLALGTALLIVAITIPGGFKIAAGLDFRIAPLIVIFLSIALQSGETRANWSAWLVLLVVGRSAAFHVQLFRGNDTGEAVHRAVKALPKDALLFNVMWNAGSRHGMDRWNPAPLNLLYYGCVDEFRFVSGLYSYKTQQPLGYLDSVSKLNWIGIDEGDPQAAFLQSIQVIRKLASEFPSLKERPVFLFLSNTDGANPVIPKDVSRTVNGQKFQIYRLR